MAEAESHDEAEAPQEEEPGEIAREATAGTSEGDGALSRLETTDELAALADEEKTEEIAGDIVDESAAINQAEQGGEGENEAPPPEEGNATEEPPAESAEVTESANEEPAAPTEGEEEKPAEEAPAPPEEPTAQAETSEAAPEQPAETAAEAAEQLESDKQKMDRKISRARFEPMRGAIEEEEDADEFDVKQKGEMEPMIAGRQSGLTEQGEFEGASDEEIEEEALPKFSRQQMIESIQQQLAERDQLKLKNQNIQHKLALYFQNKRAEDRGASETVGEGEQKYASLLSKYTDLVREKRILDERSREQLDGLRERREQLRNDGESLLTQLRELKKTTVLTSVSVKTGKIPQWDDVEPQFSLEAKKDADIHKLLIENIILRNRIHKIEDTMKAKDKLGEGLHMIDFEQLKIENQTYNEKIEERNEDISKLRKKITTSVEVLTHVKEKLEYLKHENEAQKIRLEEVDKNLAVKRTKVTRLKQSRDSLRNDNERLKQSAGLLGKNDLLRDFENKVDEAEMLRRRLADLQVTHAEVSMSNAAINKKINGLKASNPNLQTSMSAEPARTPSFQK